MYKLVSPGGASSLPDAHRDVGLTLLADVFPPGEGLRLPKVGHLRGSSYSFDTGCRECHVSSLYGRLHVGVHNVHRASQMKCVA